MYEDNRSSFERAFDQTGQKYLLTINGAEAITLQVIVNVLVAGSDIDWDNLIDRVKKHKTVGASYVAKDLGDLQVLSAQASHASRCGSPHAREVEHDYEKQRSAFLKRLVLHLFKRTK